MNTQEIENNLHQNGQSEEEEENRQGQGLSQSCQAQEPPEIMDSKQVSAQIQSSKQGNKNDELEEESSEQGKQEKCQGDEENQENFENYHILKNMGEKEQSENEESYPEIRKEEMQTVHFSQPTHQLATSKLQQDHFQKKSLLINIQQTEDIPSVELEPSPKGRKPISIKINMYNINTFMKMETQNYVLEVFNPNNEEEYQVQRRYSDFVSFYQSLIYNQLGYILSPFPQKGLDSFIKIKLGLGENHEGEKQQRIEKRMTELEKFINFVTFHQQLSNSEQVSIFLQKNEEQYEKGKRRMEKYVQEYKTLENSWNFMNLVGKSASFLTSYMTAQKPFELGHSQKYTKNNIQFGIIMEKLKTQKTKHQELLSHIVKLQLAEKQLGQFTDIQTDIDTLLDVCAKHTSGRQYSLAFAHFLESQVIDGLNYNIRKLEECEKNLLYRVQLLEVGEQVNKKEEKEKGMKIQRRVQRFERNFMFSWQSFNQQMGQSYTKIVESFQAEWRRYKGMMSKVWRKKY